MEDRNDLRNKRNKKGEMRDKAEEMRGMSPWNSVTMDYILTVLRNFHKTQEIILDWYFGNVTQVEPWQEEDNQPDGKDKKETDAFIFSDEERRKLKKDLSTVMGTYEKAVRTAGLELLKRHGSRKMRSMLEENIYFKTRELYWGSNEEEELEKVWLEIKKMPLNGNINEMESMKDKAGKLYSIAKNMIDEKRHRIIMELGDTDNALQLLGRKRHEERRNHSENVNQSGEWMKEAKDKGGLEDMPEL